MRIDLRLFFVISALTVLVVAVVIPYRFRSAEVPQGIPATVEILDPVPTPDMPGLSDAQATEAISILQDDPIFQQLTAGHSYTTTAGIWHAKGFDPIGAAVTLDLDQPATFAFDWPYVDVDENYYPQYPRKTDYYTTTAQTYFILVDLDNNVVADIGSLGGSDEYPEPRTPVAPQ